MATARKTPIRTCVACRTASDKRNLMRIVRTKEGDVFIDAKGRENGRGAYVCPESTCLEKALAGKLAASLKVRVTEDDIERLRSEFERIVAGSDFEGQGR